MSPRPPVVCSKCWSPCPVSYDWRSDEFAKTPDGYPGPNPWAKITVRGTEVENVTHRCPIHGELVELPGGLQVFDEPDAFVLGPDGDRLFEV